jgi:Fic family protein
VRGYFFVGRTEKCEGKYGRLQGYNREKTRKKQYFHGYIDKTVKRSIIGYMAKKLGIYRKISALRRRYYKALAGKESLVRMIGEAEVSDHVYNSNAIENSTLSLEETEKILLQIDLDRYISDRESFEAKNLARIVKYCDQKAPGKELSRDMVLFLHKTLLANIQDDIAGRFRSGDEYVRIGDHIASAPTVITKEIDEALEEFYGTEHLHIIERIAQLHLSFETTHPFVDGNGRIGRVVNNYLLIREGYVTINIAFADRLSYYNAFKEYAQKNETKAMEVIVGKALTNSYHKRLAFMEDKEIITLREYARRISISHSNAINKARRQTIEAFHEKGVWKIGV